MSDDSWKRRSEFCIRSDTGGGAGTHRAPGIRLVRQGEAACDVGRGGCDWPERGQKVMKPPPTDLLPGRKGSGKVT